MATAKQLEYSKQYKQYERATNPNFVEKEKLYRRRYAKRRYALAQLAIAFTLAFPNQYQNFLRELGKNI